MQCFTPLGVTHFDLFPPTLTCRGEELKGERARHGQNGLPSSRRPPCEILIFTRVCLSLQRWSAGQRRANVRRSSVSLRTRLSCDRRPSPPVSYYLSSLPSSRSKDERLSDAAALTAAQIRGRRVKRAQKSTRRRKNALARNFTTQRVMDQ